MRTALVGLALSLMAGALAQSFEYSDADGKTFEGFAARPKSRDMIKRPLVLVLHDWNGLDGYEEGRCRQLADLGYVAVALDVYGKGVRPKTPQDCAAEAGKYYGNAALWQARLKLGLEAALKRPDVDSQRVAVIGYCFGGTGALEMVRSRMPIVGAVAFHGGLQGPSKANADEVNRARVLALNGEADPMVPASMRAAFEKEMKDARIRYRMVNYGGAVHAFTVPGSEKAGIKGVAYDANADRKSWAEMKKFLAQVF